MTRFSFNALVVLSLCFFGITQALALMPPHVRSAIPGNNDVLEGNTIIVKGYSLAYAEPGDLKIILLKTGEEIPYTTKLACEWEGECGEDSLPGSCQEKCEMSVILQKVSPGEKYEIRFLDWKSQFTANTREKEGTRKENKGK